MWKKYAKERAVVFFIPLHVMLLAMREREKLLDLSKCPTSFSDTFPSSAIQIQIQMKSETSEKERTILQVLSDTDSQEFPSPVHK